MMDETQCRACARPSLLEVERFSSLPRVTSDTRPFPAGGKLLYCEHCGTVQKRADSRWLSEIEEIYGRYDMYAQADGQEQRVFDASGSSAHRSTVLLERALGGLPRKARGALLDVGCGTGVTLAAFTAVQSGWWLYGQDLDGRYIDRLRRIPGFAGLLRELPGWPGDPFDIVTMIHSLEHFEDPVTALTGVRGSLAEDGRLLVQVPDAEASPFDLLVADHLCHFDPRTLRYLVERGGYAVERCEAYVPKEITLVARGGESPATEPAAAGPLGVKARLEAQIAWLESLRVQAAGVATKTGSFGIFGTAIAGTWLFGALEQRAEFFVDEDLARVGRGHCDRPILGPESVPRDAHVYVPLLPPTAAAVAARHGGCAGKYHVPPPLSAAARPAP